MKRVLHQLFTGIEAEINSHLSAEPAEHRGVVSLTPLASGRFTAVIRYDVNDLPSKPFDLREALESAWMTGACSHDTDSAARNFDAWYDRYYKEKE